MFTDEPDGLNLECIRWLNADSLFAINLTIHLSEYLSSEGVVSGFVLLVTKQTVSKNGTTNEETLISPYKKSFVVIHFTLLKFVLLD